MQLQFVCGKLFIISARMQARRRLLLSVFFKDDKFMVFRNLAPIRRESLSYEKHHVYSPGSWHPAKRNTCYSASGGRLKHL